MDEIAVIQAIKKGIIRIWVILLYDLYIGRKGDQRSTFFLYKNQLSSWLLNKEENVPLKKSKRKDTTMIDIGLDRSLVGFFGITGMGLFILAWTRTMTLADKLGAIAFGLVGILWVLVRMP